MPFFLFFTEDLGVAAVVFVANIASRNAVYELLLIWKLFMVLCNA